MAEGRLKLIVTRPLPAPVEARMEGLFEVELRRGGGMDAAELGDAMRRCDALASTVTDRIDAVAIAAAGPRLRLIANFGVGTDKIDLAAARAAGIAVTNTPDVLTDDTADIAMALILMAMRRLGEGERIVRGGRWSGWRPTDFLGRSLSGKALAIIGMGRIGQALARRAAASGMHIHYHNRSRLPDEAERPLAATFHPDLDEMVGSADVVSLNAPYGPPTHHLIDARRLSLMKSVAILINTARGAIVDQDALIAALESGAIAGAGLDVYPKEPHVDPRLIALENVVLLPHMGSATHETRIAMGNRVVDNVLAFAEGRELPDRVG